MGDIEQLAYFTSIYTAVGIDPLDAGLQARGAVLGQILGANAIVEDGTQDALAERFLGYAAWDSVSYGVPIDASMPIEAPGPLLSAVTTVRDDLGF